MQNRLSVSYPANKASEIEWVGEIPKHWSVKPLFALFRERHVVNEGNRETNVLSLSYGQIIRRDIESNFGLLPESFETYNIIESQNIVLRLTDLQNDKRSLRCGLAKERGIITSAYLTLAGKTKVDCEYMFYQLHSYDILKVFYSMGGGVRQSIKFGDLKRLPILEPPIEEQRIIVEVLNEKIRLINALITKKEKMIELLKEERAAVINHAVTCGLDPKAALQDTGIEWLGRVPKHWEVKRLKYVGQSIIGLTYAPDDVVPEGTLVLRSSNIQGGKIVFDDNVYVNKLIPSKLVVKKDDILVCSRNGSRALIGKCALLDERCEGQSFGVFMTVFRSKFNRFVYHIFNSTIFQFHIGSFLTATINQLTTENLNGIIAPFPPVDEQAQIVEFLDKKTAQIDGQIGRAERCIELLKEYRTALISEAVMGKIDLREMANAGR